ncbi:MAG: hypothetical protein B6242_05305, partial [Anaerolineaceae bacterium 4572_78]
PLAVESTNPTNNALNVVVTSNVTTSFSISIENTTVNTGTFTIRGEQTGIYTGAYTLPTTDTIQFDPTMNFKSGEVINASISNGLESTGAINATPYQWQFHAAVNGGHANFISNTQTFSSSMPL